MAKDAKKEENTEQRILEAAATIFVRDGIQGARMQDIADLANINRAMLHYYFRDRESLSKKAFERITNNFAKSIHLVIDSNASFEEKLDKYIDTQIDIYSNNPDIIIFALHGSLKDKDFLTKVFKHHVEEDNLFFLQLEQEVEQKRINKFTRLEFMVFVTSLCAYPFVAGAIYRMILGLDMNDWTPLLGNYKQRLPGLIKRAIYVDYKENKS